VRYPPNSGIFLLLGSNLGHPLETLAEARTRIETQVGTLVNRSAVYRTAAWGKKDQPDFYNQVVEVSSRLPPDILLKKILEIERELGRVRLEKWGSRTIDIDILFIGESKIDSPHLQVPHPGIPNRKFTLGPLAEIAPDLVHPQLNKKISDLLAECPDPLMVTRVTEN
jgi:2-amino-4-hydroxy-6-hydroxymethyldihydropteridine diphosphokinase